VLDATTNSKRYFISLASRLITVFCTGLSSLRPLFVAALIKTCSCRISSYTFLLYFPNVECRRTESRTALRGKPENQGWIDGRDTIFNRFQKCPVAHPDTYHVPRALIPKVKLSGVNLTAHLNLVPRLSLRGTVASLLPYVFRACCLKARARTLTVRTSRDEEFLAENMGLYKEGQSGKLCLNCYK
jgi:hypothetical protein